jgi:uncharacterized protein (DUF1501 family)
MSNPSCHYCNGLHPNRREFLRVGSLGFLGINLAQYLALEQGIAASTSPAKRKAQACILLWLDGGQSHIDTWDPKPNSSFKPVSTNVPGIQVSELLPRLARRMDKLSIIRSMQTLENNHAQATHYVATGHRPSTSMRFPSFGSIITKEVGPRSTIPPYVMVPAMPKGKNFDAPFKAYFVGAQYDPMIIPDPSQESFDVPDLSLPKSVTLAALEDRRAFLKIVDQTYRKKVQDAEFANLDTFREQAWNIITAPGVRDAFDLSKESDKTKEAYGRTGFGQSALLARRLVEAGCRFVTAGGYKAQAWDTHSTNDKALKDELAPTYDQTLSALIDDLEQRGLLESTVVIALGEFGRTAHINPNGGRDHWPDCWSVVLGGGGIAGGKVVGASDSQGAFVSERPVSMGDMFATVYKAFGIDWTKTYMHPIGRPLKIANSFNDETGKPIEELI